MCIQSKFSLISSFLLLSLVIFSQTVFADHIAGHVAGSVADPPSTAFDVATSNQFAGSIGNIGRGAESFATLVSLGTTIAFSLAFLFFFYNLYKFIKSASAESKEEAKGKLAWSLVAIIVITSLWGIIAFFRGGLGIRGVVTM